MKILLTTLNSKYIHSSLAVRYLEAYSRKEFPGIVREEYTINDNLGSIAGQIFKQGAALIGFSCYIWNITQTLTLAELLKKVAPDTVIILGGPEVSYDPEIILAAHPFIDYIIAGEGEEAFLEFLRRWSSDGEVSRIPALCFRRGKKILCNPGEFLTCLDQLPSPYEGPLEALANKIVYYESSRGCPFECQYCLSSTFRGVRFFSLERVTADLARLIDAGVTQVKFVDRTFNCRKYHALEIMKFLVKYKGRTTFHFEMAADLLDEEFLDFLAGVPEGLFQFEIGVQSTNQVTLEQIQRKMDLKRVRHNVAYLRRRDNIHLHLDLIAGLPMEDYASFCKSFNEVYAMGPHKLQLGFLKLLKGSGVRLRTEEFGYKFLDNPPYEILENKDLSYREILRLKAVEELLERYYNSSRFRNTLSFILTEYQDRPFSFFEELAGYWEDMGYNRQAQGVTSLYQILKEFYQQKGRGNQYLFMELLKLDFLLHEPFARVPPFLNKIDIPGFQERIWEFLKTTEYIKKYLPGFIDNPAKEIIKKVRFEAFVIEGDQVILFDYSKRHPVTGEAYYQSVPL